jgi:hypothetical protein
MWQISRPDESPGLILIEADYVALDAFQVDAFLAAINEVREGRADRRSGETTW